VKHAGPLAFLAATAVTLVASRARAATIHVTPADTYAKIEGANAGDEVIVAPGTYAFRVYLTKQAPASAPIHIHAEDPANPPVWDPGTTLVENTPGSYGGGDKGRGCWQVSGGTNYVIEGIVFTHCRTASNNSAGIRYYNGASGLVVRSCVFRDNDDGMTGGTQDSEATVEFCEFDHNGNTSASSSAPTHNLYIYGGTFTLRYSYVHDPAQAQNFHIRAKTALIESNWFARAASYEGDLMTDDDYAGGSTFAQSIVLRGNVFVQGTTQANTGQIFVLYNDTGASGLTLSAHVLYNTLVGAGGHAAFVHLSNADGTPMQAQVDDNVVSGTSVPVLVEDASHATVSGTHNWLATGAAAGALAGSVVGSAPGFANPTASDFHLAPGSACIGGASVAGVADLPGTEYWEDETVTRQYRVRSTVLDIGAFESTTSGPGIGPGAAVPTGDGGATSTGDGGVTPAADGGTPGAADASAAGAGGDASGGGAPGDASGAGGAPGDGAAGSSGGASGSSGGCACDLATPHGRASAPGAALAALVLLAARRRRRAGSRVLAGTG
jgi:hypothetical protein